MVPDPELPFTVEVDALFVGIGAVVISEEEGRRHRIAFNSLYLFSFRSINYKSNGEELYNFTRGATRQLLSLRRPLGF